MDDIAGISFMSRNFPQMCLKTRPFNKAGCSIPAVLIYFDRTRRNKVRRISVWSFPQDSLEWSEENFQIYKDQPGDLTPKRWYNIWYMQCIYPGAQLWFGRFPKRKHHWTNGSAGHVVLHFLVIVHGRVLSAWTPGARTPWTFLVFLDGGWWGGWLNWRLIFQLGYNMTPWMGGFGLIRIHALVVSIHITFPSYNYR